MRLRFDWEWVSSVLVVILVIALTMYLLMCSGGCSGCQQNPTWGAVDAVRDAGGSVASDPTLSLKAMNPLTMVALPCLGTGAIMLIVTRGRRGWWGVGLGVGLCALAMWLIRYGTWIFIPVLVLSLGWAIFHLFRIPREVKKNGLPLIRKETT